MFILIVGFTLNKDIAVLALTLAVGFGGLAWSGFIINHLDIAPRYASLLLGISNCFATVPGMLSPTVVGIITVNEVGVSNQVSMIYLARPCYTLLNLHIPFYTLLYLLYLHIPVVPAKLVYI